MSLGLHIEKTLCTAHLIILTDSVYRSNESNYSQVLLEECKYIVKDKTIKRFI